MSWIRDVERFIIPRKRDEMTAETLSEYGEPEPHIIDCIETTEQFTRAIMPALLEVLPDELAHLAFAEITRRFDEERMFIGRTMWRSKYDMLCSATEYVYEVGVMFTDDYRRIGQAFIVSDRINADGPHAAAAVHDMTVNRVGGEVFRFVEEYNAKKRN